MNNDPKQNLSSSLTSFNFCSPLPFFILLQLCYHFFSWLLIKNRFSPCRGLLEYDRISDGAHINGSGVSYRAECRPHKDDWPCYSQPLRVVGEQLWANERVLTRASLIEVYVCKNKCQKILNNNPKSSTNKAMHLYAIMIQKLIHTRKRIIFMRWVGILIQSSDSILLNGMVMVRSISVSNGLRVLIYHHFSTHLPLWSHCSWLTPTAPIRSDTSFSRGNWSSTLPPKQTVDHRDCSEDLPTHLKSAGELLKWHVQVDSMGKMLSEF